MLKTAEFVAPGHPDKICDQISDSILDAYLRNDPMSRVAVEAVGGHGHIAIIGEVTSRTSVNHVQVVKDVLEQNKCESPFSITDNIRAQSREIAEGVDNGGAGDQGIMVGYATSENKSMMPQEYFVARDIIENLPSNLGPDAKSQVTMKDKEVVTIVLSAQNQVMRDGEHSLEKYRSELQQIYPNATILINPSGSFTIGGFDADTGLTGRKIVVDNYGPQIPIGGGCFSGKDATKVDRSAAYMARKIACDYIRQGWDEATVKLAYAIGVEEPVMAVADISRGEGLREVRQDNLLQKSSYDLTPNGIIRSLRLRKPIFAQTAKGGHFGKGFAWD
jgi:S-adenosylmethionine synthetase